VFTFLSIYIHHDIEKKRRFGDSPTWDGVSRNSTCYYTETAVHAEVYLHAVLLLELKVLLPQGVDTINHDLHQLHLRVSKTMLV